MPFTPPDLSSILTNEQELNNRLTALRAILRNQWTAIGDTYSDSYSINKLITDMSNPLPFVVKRNSEYKDGQLGTRVAVTGCDVYSWNQYNPTPYNDNDYWYLQSLSKTKTSNTSVAWGQFNTGSVLPTDKFDLVMYGRDMENFNNGAFSGVGFTYTTPAAETAFSGLFIGITLDSGTYRPAYAIFNNSTTPTSIVKMDYGTYPSASTEFRLLMQNNPDNDWLRLYWYKEDSGKFVWNDFIDYSDLPSGFSQVENLVFGNVCYGTGLGRMSYVPRLCFASPCRFKIL